MAISAKSRANVLGDLRAEFDHRMLQSAFLETADYKTLIDTTDRPIVVGRRGTGKSALAYQLEKHWRSASHTDTIALAPTEEQIIGLRGLMPEFYGSKYSMIRAGARTAWRYALLAETAHALTRHYKFMHVASPHLLRRHADGWVTLGSDLAMRLRKKLLQVGVLIDASTRISEIPALLEVNQLQDAVNDALTELKHSVVIMIDRVDEGYEPDELGVALVDALVLAAIDMNSRVDQVRVTLFLRDNMARAVEQLDPDYSRNIEGQTLRLHWEEGQLFSMICNRLRLAFGIEAESDLKVWNRCTARGLEGRDGFKKCLRLTLYRPRDILALLNDAFHVAARENRQQIIDNDVEQTAQQISRNRLDDLYKEYSVILPGLRQHASSFAQGPPEMTVAEAYTLVDRGSDALKADEAAAQTFTLLNSPSDIGNALYSVGFLGVKDPATTVTAFCHDGRMLDRSLKDSDRVMIHPCYWMALGIVAGEIDAGRAQEIFDDYDIRVVSARPEIRKAKLGQMIGEFDRMPIGDAGASDFEEWCLRAVQIIFAVQLTNIELHPNGSAVQRRDVVGRNLAQSPFWKRVREDYGVRQVIFEIKNYKELGPDEYRQMSTYLNGEYGNAGFMITREDNEDLLSNRELPWMREIYNKQHKLVVKLTGTFLRRILSKLRSPQRHDEADQQLDKLFDRYTRHYLGEPTKLSKRRKRRH
jgi:Cdc6-like AAA superfamily ATPase